MDRTSAALGMLGGPGPSGSPGGAPPTDDPMTLVSDAADKLTQALDGLDKEAAAATQQALDILNAKVLKAPEGEQP